MSFGVVHKRHLQSLERGLSVMERRGLEMRSSEKVLRFFENYGVRTDKVEKGSIVLRFCVDVFYGRLFENVQHHNIVMR